MKLIIVALIGLMIGYFVGITDIKLAPDPNIPDWYQKKIESWTPYEPFMRNLSPNLELKLKSANLKERKVL